MKDIKFKIFASALASVLLVGCNDLDTEPYYHPLSVPEN